MFMEAASSDTIGKNKAANISNFAISSGFSCDSSRISYFRKGGVGVKIHYKSKLFRLPLLRNYAAIVLGKHCFVKADHASARLLRHEEIHQEQMKRHGVILFYLIYLKDYFRNLLIYRNHDRAYFNIPFEVEAFARESEGIPSREDGERLPKAAEYNSRGGPGHSA